MSERYWAVRGKLPGGKSYRGIVMTRGSSQVVERGPSLFTRKPWDKRSLTLAELENYGQVERANRPTLTARIQQQLEHKFVQATDIMDIMVRGKFLQVSEDIIERLG